MRVLSAKMAFAITPACCEIGALLGQVFCAKIFSLPDYCVVTFYFPLPILEQALAPAQTIPPDVLESRLIVEKTERLPRRTRACHFRQRGA